MEKEEIVAELVLAQTELRKLEQLVHFSALSIQTDGFNPTVPVQLQSLYSEYAPQRTFLRRQIQRYEQRLSSE